MIENAISGQDLSEFQWFKSVETTSDVRAGSEPVVVIKNFFYIKRGPGI